MPEMGQTRNKQLPFAKFDKTGLCAHRFVSQRRLKRKSLKIEKLFIFYPVATNISSRIGIGICTELQLNKNEIFNINCLHLPRVVWQHGQSP